MLPPQGQETVRPTQQKEPLLLKNQFVLPTQQKEPLLQKNQFVFPTQQREHLLPTMQPQNVLPSPDIFLQSQQQSSTATQQPRNDDSNRIQFEIQRLVKSQVSSFYILQAKCEKTEKLMNEMQMTRRNQHE
ncbi:hypothetical protein ACFFRR_005243 [Megaselia abdita]